MRHVQSGSFFLRLFTASLTHGTAQRLVLNSGFAESHVNSGFAESHVNKGVAESHLNKGVAESHVNKGVASPPFFMADTFVKTIERETVKQPSALPLNFVNQRQTWQRPRHVTKL